MAGIYLHIPFCRKACHYCNFHFSTQLQLLDEMAAALIKEAEMRRHETTEKIQTIYWGGGTPSLLSTDNLHKILETLYQYYPIDENIEMTLEANPDDITKEKASEWKSIGINRFSIGIQSFDDQNLAWMNRAHNASQSQTCINIIRDAGFENFSIDLIYGTPGQTLAAWEKEIDIALDKKIPHLSCYALTIEEGTALQHLIEQGKREAVNTDEQSDRFNLLVEKITDAGYHHYEISNMALPGFESQHNSAYWEGSPYLGFGPSAHSFNGKKRSWNIAHNIDYIRSIKEGNIPSTAEELTELDLLNEYIMTSLRSSKGLNKSRILNQWGEDKLKAIAMEMKKSMMVGHVLEHEEVWKLSANGKFLADGIAASLFFLPQ